MAIVAPAAQAESIDRMVEAYNRYPASDTSSAKSDLFNRIQIEIEKKDNQQTIPLLQQLVRKYPQNPFVRATLANALVKRERLSEAIAEYRQAIAIDPTQRDSYNSLQLAIDRQANNEAIAVFRQIVQTKPTAAAYRALAKALKDRDLVESGRAFDRAISLDPTLSVAKTNLA